MTEISQKDAADALRLLGAAALSLAVTSPLRRAAAALSLAVTSPLRRAAAALLAKYPPGPELASCPFCRGVNIVVAAQPSDYSHADDGWVVVCDVNRGGCGASSGFRRDKAEAVRAWNRRS